MKNLDTTRAILLLLSLFMIFFFINSPFDYIKENALYILLIISSIGGIILTQKESLEMFQSSPIRLFVEKATIGIIVGVIGMLFALFFIGAITAIYNFFGTISSISAGSYTDELQFYTLYHFPIAETFILIGGVLALTILLPKVKVGKFNIMIVPIFFFMMILFGAFHYADRGTGTFESSPIGLISFVANTNNFGTPEYVGALPQVLLAMIWLIGAFIYRNWLVALFAHIFANVISLGFFLGFFQPVILFTLAIIGLIVFFGFTRTNAFNELFKINLGYFYG